MGEHAEEVREIAQQEVERFARLLSETIVESAPRGFPWAVVHTALKRYREGEIGTLTRGGPDKETT